MNTYNADAGPRSELGGTGLRRSFLRVTHMPSLQHINYPGASGPALRKHAGNTRIPFRAVPVFYRLKFTAHNHAKSEVVDAVHVQPKRLNSRGQIKRPWFNTVLVCNGQGGMHGSNGKSIHINV